MKISPSENYSRYVSLMKILLPVGIILSIGLVIGWQHIFRGSGKEAVVKVDESRPEIKENRMMHPQYSSTDAKGQPYEVSAKWAKQLPDNRTELIKPEGSIAASGGEIYSVTAKNGVYDNDEKILDLEGDVTLTSADGLRVLTQKAKVTIDENIIESENFVEGESPRGELMGKNGFKVETISEGKKIITLKGPSRVIIYKQSEGAHE